MEDEEKKRAKRWVAVRIMAAEDTHAGIMEFFRRNLGEPDRMLGLKNAAYVEVFGDSMGQRLLRLNNVEWRRGEPLRMQVIFARMSLDEIVKYITVELKLNAKNEAHVQDRHGHGQRGHREDRHHREIQEDTANSAEDGSGSGQDHWSREDHEEAHFFAFVAHNVKNHGQDRSRWSQVGPKKGKEPRRIGNPPLSFREYRSQHDGCWVCYGKGNNHAHEHRQCKVYEADKKAYFAAHPEKKPKEQRISDWKAKGGDGGKGQGKGQGKSGGRGYGGGPGQDRRVRSIEEVAEDMLRTLERLNRPDQAKRSTLSGNFYVADITDWDMIMGYDFMVANAIGALPHRATLVREDDECLTWLSTDYACGSSQWNAEEEDRIVREVQAVGAKSRGDRGVQLTEYGMAPQVYARMIQTLGAEVPETDVFASWDAPLLRKCRRHWHRGDSAWHRHWGLKEWGPMYWHGSLDNTRRTVEKIIADRAKGILVITGIVSTPCPLEGLKSTLDSITLNEMSFGPEEELFIDAKGVSMPSPGQAWGTKAFLVDGAQAQPTGDEAFIRRVEAVPMKVMFEPKEGTDQPIDGIDVLSDAEIDDVVNYMRMGIHDRVAAKKRRAMVTSPHWWDDKMLVTGKYEKDEFVARVMDHIADQYDGPVGSDPPTWDFPRMGADSDSHQPDAANFRRLSVGRAPHDDEDGMSDEEKSESDPEEAYTAVRSVVSIPKQAAEEAQENPKVAELKERLIKAYPRLFSGVAKKNPPDRGRFGTAKIKLKPNPKIYRHREYQLQGDRAGAIKKLLAEFIERGWIEPSDSEWASPAFIVPKKEKGEWRLVVDYRGLNEQTEHNSYSLPLIDSILQKQQKKRIFTVLDLKHGYHQMPLHPDSRPCTAMSTPLGPMQWKVVPMGAKNGNAAFQRMMEDLLGPVRDCADPFVDDIIIGSGTENMTEDELIDAHEKDLRRVLSELDKHNMVCKPTKASLFVKEVEFAGHVVGHGQRRPMPGKLASLHHWEKPQTISELRSFMGFCNYYSGYVRMYAELSGPLHKMLQVGKFDGRKGSKKKLAWTPEAEDAFNRLKERLLGQLGLFLVDPDKGFVLRTDASDYAVGAVLEQVRDDGTHVPVAFWSRILAEGQRRTWTAREKETYAIVCALRKWSGHIGLQPVVVCTDHQSLQS